MFKKKKKESSLYNVELQVKRRIDSEDYLDGSRVDDETKAAFASMDPNLHQGFLYLISQVNFPHRDEVWQRANDIVPGIKLMDHDYTIPEEWKFLIHDDIEQLQLKSGEFGFNVNAGIPLRRLKDGTFRYVPIIAIAAYFAAIKCFKFCLLNGWTSWDHTSTNLQHYTYGIFYYAVAGGDFEIVQLASEQDPNMLFGTQAACRFHRQQVLEWLIEVQGKTPNGMKQAILSSNYRAVQYLFANGYKIYGDEIGFSFWRVSDDPCLPELLFSLGCPINGEACVRIRGGEKAHYTFTSMFCPPKSIVNLGRERSLFSTHGRTGVSWGQAWISAHEKKGIFT